MRKKQLPTLKSDAEAEAFVADADLTAYDLSKLVPVRFELKRKDKSVIPHLPDNSLPRTQER
ncbi:CopG family antitoxin [Methylocystis iwaonis]|uniref:CopG family antitoxin n=1 Tax=Methylocystis iwaonis TaxID=2885079 RepID=UPI002E7B345D|nr:CopG family antitoxin [Methylocystis iwaonis]